jgi:hypothetical protein
MRRIWPPHGPVAPTGLSRPETACRRHMRVLRRQRVVDDSKRPQHWLALLRMHTRPTPGRSHPGL